jgi:hypothetical protein
MPIFKPRAFEEDDYDESAIESALKDQGLGSLVEDAPQALEVQANQVKSKDLNENEFRKILNRNGASVDNASRTIARIMHSGKFENSQLRAAELVLDLQGIRDKEGRLQRTAVFNFIVNDSTVNIQNIFAPTRTTASLAEDLRD